MPTALLRLDRHVHDAAADVLLVVLDPLLLWTTLKRCWSAHTGPPRGLASAARAHRDIHSAASPSALARGPTVCARALLVGRERRNASRHARGTGCRG
eukprot:4732961-Pleurochrysis_carterae.AAC.1